MISSSADFDSVLQFILLLARWPPHADTPSTLLVNSLITEDLQGITVTS